MRILRLELGFARGPIEMHPFVTAVQGLDPVNREVFIEAVRLLAAGSSSGIRGLLDVNGQLVDLAGDQNPRVGPVTTEDVAVMLDELPMLAHADPVSLRAELDQMVKRAKIDAVHVEEVRADLDPAAAARLQNLRDLMNEGEQQSDSMPTGEVKRMLSMFNDIEPHVFDMPTGVVELIERWKTLEIASVNSDELEATLATRVSVAEASVISAEREMDVAVEAATPKLLSNEDETRLEELAHPTEGRKKKARARTDEEEAELETLLCQVGQPSYTAYRMYRVAPTALASDRALVESAKGRLAAAREELAELKLGGGVPELTELKTELAAIRAAASEHLGTNLPENLGPALQSLGVTMENPAWALLASELKSEMSDVVGVPVPVMTNTEVPDWVRDWLAAYEADPESAKVGLDPAELARGIAEAEVALQHHARSMARIDRLEAKADDGRRMVAELSAALANAEGGTPPHPEELLGYLDPIIDRIYTQAGGSAPFVIAGEFKGMSDADVVSILDAYKPVSAELQIIVVSDRAIVSQWARQAGPEHAAISKAQGATF
jgi:hypothetical protein